MSTLNSVILGCLQSSANYLSYSVLIGLPAGFKLKPLDYLLITKTTIRSFNNPKTFQT